MVYAQIAHSLYLWLDEAYAIATSGAKSPYFNKQNLREAFWRCLIADRSSTTHPAPSLHGNDYEAFLKLRELNSLTDAAVRTATDEDYDVIVQCDNFFKLLYHGSYGRKLATTKKGYIALVPPRTQAGDTIYIPLGAQVPFVLRENCGNMNMRDKTISAFQLVGECYVHGVMDGEMADAGTVEWITLL